MKIVADTHSHTLVSGHAYSTIAEMANMAKEHGMEAICFTEHAPAMIGTCGPYYFENARILPRERWGIRTYFGTELNILNKEGEIDLPDRTLKQLDIVIASVHIPCFQDEFTVENVTNAVVNAMKNPYINIIGHPDDERAPLDYEVIVKMAEETGTLLEVNQSSMRKDTHRKNAREHILTMLSYCKKYGVCITTGSDAHVDLDAGKFDLVSEILKESDFPEELVVTTSINKLKPYMNRYKNL